jgi:hypothetical protein
MKKVGKKLLKRVITHTLQMWLNWTLKIQIGMKELLSKLCLPTSSFMDNDPLGKV